MNAPTDVLWRVNNEYRKRLSQAQTFLDLLEQMILATDDRQPRTLETLRYAREQVNSLIEEHRRWRNRFYYDFKRNQTDGAGRPGCQSGIGTLQPDADAA